MSLSKLTFGPLRLWTIVNSLVHQKGRCDLVGYEDDTRFHSFDTGQALTSLLLRTRVLRVLERPSIIASGQLP